MNPYFWTRLTTRSLFGLYKVLGLFFFTFYKYDMPLLQNHIMRVVLDGVSLRSSDVASRKQSIYTIMFSDGKKYIDQLR